MSTHSTIRDAIRTSCSTITQRKNIFGISRQKSHFSKRLPNRFLHPEGYYSYDLGTWHIIVLNAHLPVHAGSAQEQWLRADLAAHPTVCTAAYWHNPRFSSGVEHGSDADMKPLWQALYDYGADVVINGHEHNYERFAPQDPQGNPDPTRGIREFVVGTGGGSHDVLGTPIANSEARNDDTYGVIKLTLPPTSYEWEFIPIAGKSFTDSGNAPCVDNTISTVVPK